MGSTHRQGCVRPDLFSHETRERFDSLRPGRQSAKFVVKYDSLQVYNAIIQATSLVLLQVEFGILKTGLHHSLTASTDAAALKISDCNKVRH